MSPLRSRNELDFSASQLIDGLQGDIFGIAARSRGQGVPYEDTSSRGL
jgi:hypothetical protein